MSVHIVHLFLAYERGRLMLWYTYYRISRTILHTWSPRHRCTLHGTHCRRWHHRCHKQGPVPQDTHTSKHLHKQCDVPDAITAHANDSLFWLKHFDATPFLASPPTVSGNIIAIVITVTSTWRNLQWLFQGLAGSVKALATRAIFRVAKCAVCQTVNKLELNCDINAGPLGWRLALCGARVLVRNAAKFVEHIPISVNQIASAGRTNPRIAVSSDVPWHCAFHRCWGKHAFVIAARIYRIGCTLLAGLELALRAIPAIQ